MCRVDRTAIPITAVFYSEGLALFSTQAIFPNPITDFAYVSKIFGTRGGVGTTYQLSQQYGSTGVQNVSYSNAIRMYQYEGNGSVFWQGLVLAWRFYDGSSGESGNLMALGGNAVLYVGGTAYSSDRRIKRNIKPLKNSLHKLMQLVGVEYDRLDNKEHNIGFVAQDVAEVFPSVVTKAPPDPSNEWVKDGVLSVAYGNLVAPIIEAIKELNRRLELLEG